MIQGMQKLTPYQIIIRSVVSGLVLGVAGGPAGCAAERPGARAGFASATPTERLVATRQAAANRDWESIPNLITGLESDDSAVRFMSIGALNRLTGKRYGYRHDAPPWERAAGVERWVTAWDQGELVPLAHASDVEASVSGEIKP